MTYPVDKLARARQLAASGEGRRRRIAADLSLSEIAAEVGVSHGTVWKWETGRRRPTGLPAIKYLRALDKLASLEGVAA